MGLRDVVVSQVTRLGIRRLEAFALGVSKEYDFRQRFRGGVNVG